MKTCRYDNPKTHCREFYKDGKLMAWVSALECDNRRPWEIHPNEPWENGKVVGNPDAMKPSDTKEGEA